MFILYYQVETTSLIITDLRKASHSHLFLLRLIYSKNNLEKHKLKQKYMGSCFEPPCSQQFQQTVKENSKKQLFEVDEVG